jgi:S-adenosylmethionine synthetase
MLRPIVKYYVRETLPQGWIDAQTVWHINPTGKFVIGGPDGDTGRPHRP